MPASASTAPPANTTSSVSSLATKSTQGSSRLYDIPSLENDGSNFQLWKGRVSMVLTIRGLMGYVDGTEKRPDGSDPLALETWLVREMEAKARILLTLKDEPLSGVLYINTAEEAWKKLKERYEGWGQQTVAYLIGELFRGTLSDESEMEPQLNAMRQKAYVLSSLGQPLDDSLVTIALVISLPPSYSTL